MQHINADITLTNPEFSADVTEATIVLSPIAIEVNAAVFTSLKHLKNKHGNQNLF